MTLIIDIICYSIVVIPAVLCAIGLYLSTKEYN